MEQHSELTQRIIDIENAKQEAQQMKTQAISSKSQEELNAIFNGTALMSDDEKLKVYKERTGLMDSAKIQPSVKNVEIKRAAYQMALDTNRDNKLNLDSTGILRLADELYQWLNR